MRRDAAVEAFETTLGEAESDRSEDAGAVTADRAGELDERREARARRPRQSRPSHGQRRTEVALPAAIGDLVNADRDQAGEAVLVEVLGDDTRDDLADGVSADPQQGGDRGLAICWASHATTSSKSRV